MELPALICRFRDPFPLPLPWPILVRLMHKLCLWCNAVISFITSGHQPPVQNKNTDEPIMEFLLPFHFDSSGYSIIGYPIKKTYHYKLSMITYSIVKCAFYSAKLRVDLQGCDSPKPHHARLQVHCVEEDPYRERLPCAAEVAELDA